MIESKSRVPFEQWQQERRERAAAKSKAVAAQKELERKKIRRNALINETPELAESVTRKQLIELIRFMTKEFDDTAKATKILIDEKITRILSIGIPTPLLHAYKKYGRHIIPRSPGFFYKASQEYGGGHDIWVNPDVPNFYTQFTEMDVLEELKPQQLFTIDKLVKKYFDTIATMYAHETRLAGRFYNVYNRLALLKKDAFAYKIYVDNKLYEIKDDEEFDVDMDYENIYPE